MQFAIISYSLQAGPKKKMFPVTRCEKDGLVSLLFALNLLIVCGDEGHAAGVTIGHVDLLINFCTCGDERHPAEVTIGCVDDVTFGKTLSVQTCTSGSTCHLLAYVSFHSFLS